MRVVPDLRLPNLSNNIIIMTLPIRVGFEKHVCDLRLPSLRLTVGMAYSSKFMAYGSRLMVGMAYGSRIKVQIAYGSRLASLTV